jgi:hypothetical protein
MLPLMSAKSFHFKEDAQVPISTKERSLKIGSESHLANCLFFRTEIEWYPGKCLTKRVLQKKPKKGSKDTKPIIMTQERKSFFNFFNPPQVPDVDEKIDEDTVS